MILNWIGIFYFSDIVYQLIEEQIRCYNQVFLVGPGSNSYEGSNILFLESRAHSMSLQIWISFFIIVDLTFGKILNI